MKREEGYYWVKEVFRLFDDPPQYEWHIAEWDGKEWWVVGQEYGFTDMNWAEIGERIECPYK